MLTKVNIVGVSGQAGSGKDEVAVRLQEKYGFVQVSLADPIKRFGAKIFGFNETQLWGPSSARNNVDKRYSKYGDTGMDPGWSLAFIKLAEHGLPWLTNLLKDSVKAHEAYASLVHWFHWLGQNHPKLSPRVMLQTLGTEYGRDRVHQDIWINTAIEASNHLLERHEESLHFTYDKTRGLLPSTVPHICRGVVISDVRFENEILAIKKSGGYLIRVNRPETDLLAQTMGITGHKSETEQEDFSVSLFDYIVNNDRSISDLQDAVDVAGNILVKE